MDHAMQELHIEEMRELEGGAFMLALTVGLTVAVISSVINNWSDIKKGVLDAHRDVRR